MHEIRLRVRRKTLVPTKHGLNHLWRSDWKLCGVIDYPQSAQLFKYINPRAVIQTDAQFCNWLKKMYGPGIYSILAWKKGREGFWGFLKVDCKEDVFIRLPKNETREHKELREQVVEYKQLKRRLTKGLDDDEKKYVEEELNSLAEENDLTKEIIELETTRHGPAPYLKSTLPVNFPHEYESLKNVVEEDSAAQGEYNEIW